MKKVIVVAAAVLMLVAMSGCKRSSGGKTETGAKPIKIAYISKMLTNPWFVAEDKGLTDSAAKLGVEYFSIDANLNDEAFEAAFNAALAQGIDGLAMTITNQGNGPSVAMRCRERGVALITLDDNIVDENGAPVPHVGLPVREVGELGGAALAKLANERNFFAPGNNVKVLQSDAPSVTVLKARLDGYRAALIANTPLTEADFIHVETSDAMLEDALVVAQATIQAHPEVTHWIVTGVNDDSAIAGLKAIEENGRIPRRNTLYCGLGGYSMSVEEFNRGNDSYITIVLDPYMEGYRAMEILYDHIVNKVPMPPETLINGNIADVNNWSELIDVTQF